MDVMSGGLIDGDIVVGSDLNHRHQHYKHLSTTHRIHITENQTCTHTNLNAAKIVIAGSILG